MGSSLLNWAERQADPPLPPGNSIDVLRAVVAGVRTAGGWRAYDRKPRVEVLRLRSLALRQRARRRDIESERDNSQPRETERDAPARHRPRVDADAPERAAGAIRLADVREPRAPPRVRRAQWHVWAFCFQRFACGDRVVTRPKTAKACLGTVIAANSIQIVVKLDDAKGFEAYPPEGGEDLLLRASYIRSLDFLVRCPPEIAWHILGYWRCQYPSSATGTSARDRMIDMLGFH